MFTFEEFAAPLIRAYGGRAAEPAETAEATLAARVPSELGRTEFVMVSLISMPGGEPGALAAYPTAKSSGAVTAFAQADGFFAIPQLSDGCPAGARVTVRRLGAGSRAADLVVIGSHCTGLDHLLGRLEAEGMVVKALNVGSMGGLAAARRGECDVAGIHLLDPESGVYNLPFLNPDARSGSGLSTHAGHRVPARRRALRGRRQRGRGGGRRSRRRAVRHGQPQSRQRHADSDRRAARRRATRRLLGAAEIARRRRRRGGAGPRGLGRGDQPGRGALRPRLPATGHGALRSGGAARPPRPRAGPAPHRTLGERGRARAAAPPRL